MNKFDLAFQKTIGHEGGYVNDPADPGGETKYGISKRSYPKVDIKALTLDQAKEIYRKDYWDKLDLEDLDPEVAAKLFDIGVNMGVGVAMRMAAEVENLGGVLGDDSDELESQIALRILRALQAERYLKLIAKNPKLVRFVRGWAKRAEG